MRHKIHAFDIHVLTRLSKRRHPGTDRLAKGLSHSANHGKLWAAIAALMWLTGNPRARRGGLHGLIAIAISSPLVNGPLKTLARRARPAGILGMPRLLGRFPTSPSFPSGHSSSAGAFAAAALLAGPPGVAVPIAVVAAGVAWSRAHVGVHYPSDIVAGAAIGAAIALGVERVAGAYERDINVLVSSPLATPDPHTNKPVADSDGVTIVMNADAGSASTETVEKIHSGLPRAELLECTGSEMEEALTKAASESKVLGVCGGDGTVRTAAAAAQQAGVPLLALPGGTLNFFCRDLQIGDMDAAIARAQSGRSPHPVDLAVIDSTSGERHTFVNAAFLGNYADLIKAREPMENALGKWPAFVIALGQTLRRSTPVKIKLDGKRMSVWLVFIGNCEYQPIDFLPLGRAEFADGMFDVRIFRCRGALSRLRLLFAVATGRPRWSKSYERHLVQSLEIESGSGSALDFVLDGEPQKINGLAKLHKADSTVDVFGR